MSSAISSRLIPRTAAARCVPAGFVNLGLLSLPEKNQELAKLSPAISWKYFFISEKVDPRSSQPFSLSFPRLFSFEINPNKR